MITTAIIKGIAKIIWVRRKDQNTETQVCRIYPLADSRVPENILNEIIPGTGVFKDPVSKERFQLLNNSLKPV